MSVLASISGFSVCNTSFLLFAAEQIAVLRLGIPRILKYYIL